MGIAVPLLLFVVLLLLVFGVLALRQSGVPPRGMLAGALVLTGVVLGIWAVVEAHDLRDMDGLAVTLAILAAGALVSGSVLTGRKE